MHQFIPFIFFSGIEGLAVYAIILFMFRYNFFKYFKPAAVMVLLIAVQSFFMREEFEHSLSFLSPLISIASTFLFLAIFVQVPIIWSIMMTLTGYFGYALLQSLIVSLSFGWFSIDAIQAIPVRGYILQVISSAIGFYVLYKIYRKGYGFTFNLDKLRFSLERVLIPAIIIIFIISLAIMMYFKDVFLNLFGFLVALIIFLIFFFRKEMSEHD